jgi:hypothetical protein
MHHILLTGNEASQAPRFREKGDTLADRATLTRSRAGVYSLRLRAPGQEDFFFLLVPKKTKPFTGPFQNGSVNSPRRSNGNICYVSMNHFETATATEQKKGTAQKKKPSCPPKGRSGYTHPAKGGRWGGLRSNPETSYTTRRTVGSEIRQTIPESR